MVNVLCNRHHSDLWWSFQLLADRLGWNLYVPYGMEWFDQGYFKMHEHPEKAEPARYMAEWFLVNEFFGDQFKHGFMGCKDYPKPNPLPLENDVKLDIIICTNRENEQPLRKYRNERQPQAKLVRQVGNRHDRVGYDNCMYSDLESFNENNTPHKILYHQEFDLNLFPYIKPYDQDIIGAFSHHLERYEPAEKLWWQYIRQFPEFRFLSYGKGNDEGYLYSKREYVEEMSGCDFIFYVKDWDGFSHVIHNSFALGRPMIVRRSDIKGKIFEPLFDETTCIFTDQIERIRDVDLEQMADNCYQRFKEVVDFDAEAVKLKEFFENLL